MQHPAYQAIINLGKAAIPMILRKLQECPQHLTYALFKITGENPVPKKHIGQLDKMTEDWLQWGFANNYL